MSKYGVSGLALMMAAGLPGVGVAAEKVATEGVEEGDEAPAQLGAVRVEDRYERRASLSRNVTVMDAATLEDEMVQSMEDVIRYMPGVSIVDLGRFGDNGFNIRGLEGDRVSLIVDGLAFPESLETAANYEFFRAGRGGLDVDTLKQIEVIKGADSITAGSGGLGGALVFTTKDPRDYLAPSGNDSHLGAKLGYTEHNDEKMYSLTLANRTGRIESMLVYTHRDGHESEGWYSSTEANSGPDRRQPDPVDRQSHNLLAKLQLVLGDAHRVGAVYEYGKADNWVENLSRVGTAAYLERWGDDSNRRDRYGVVYEGHFVTPFFDSIEAQLDRQQNDSVGYTLILAGANCPVFEDSTSGPCLRSEDRASEQVLDRLAVDFTKDVEAGGLRHFLVYGTALQRRDVSFSAIDTRWRTDGSVANVDIDPTQVPDTDVQAWNLYLSNRMSLLEERLSVTAGMRYDRYDYSPTLGPLFQDETGTVLDRRFSAPSWQTGVEYRVQPQHALWAQVARGFRAPTVGEMYAPTATAVATDVATGEEVQVWNSAANPDLGAEKSLNTELGYRWETARGHIGLSLFRDRYSDFIESTRLIRNPEIEYESCNAAGTCTITVGNSYTTRANIGKVTVKGAELDGRLRVGEGWLLRFSWTHSEGERADGTPLDSINPHNGILGLSHFSSSGRWMLTGNVSRSQPKKRDDVNVTGSTEPFLSASWTVFDVFGGYNVTEALRIQGGLYNVFNEEYYLWPRIRLVQRGETPLFGQATETGFGRYSEPGRNARVTVSYRF